jgi:hypothetical protein
MTNFRARFRIERAAVMQQRLSAPEQEIAL